MADKAQGVAAGANENDTNNRKRAKKGAKKGGSTNDSKADHTPSNAASAKNGSDSDPALEPPKRFLTAYNFFFMHERAAFLEAQSAKTATPDEVRSQPNPPPVRSEAIDKDERPWTQKKKKRQHVKTPGMIGFTNLVKLVAAKWKEISPEDRKIYDEMAKDDLARYRAELQEYKEKKRLAEEEAKKKGSNADISASQQQQQQQSVPAPDDVLSYQGTTVPDTTDSSLLQVNGIADSHTQPRLNSPSPPEISNRELNTSIMSMQLAQPPRPSHSRVLRNSSSFSIPGENEIVLSDSDSSELADGDIESTAIETITMDSFTLGSFTLMSITTDDIDNVAHPIVVYESLTTRIMRMADTYNKFKGKTGFVAMKALTDQFPDAALVARLENEFAILQRLSGCKYTRAALQETRHEGMCAICLDWVEGETLREWIRSTHGKAEDMTAQGNSIADSILDHESAVSLAWEITKATSEIHNSGVVHNKISADNIIVDVDKDDGTFSVKLIDFGMASMLTEQSQTPDKRQDDLISLGAVFFELFSGKYLDIDKIRSTNSKRSSPGGKKRSNEGDQKIPSNTDPSLQQELYSYLKSKVPLSIFSLVFNLLEKNGTDYHYKSASEVDQDLYVMLTDPENYLLDKNDDSNTGQLNFPSDKLFGRADQISELVNSYNRVIGPEGSPELILVSGYSGSGKSALVQQARRSFNGKSGLFLYGKFDQLRQVEPLSAIVSAFSDLCREIIKGGTEDLTKMRTAIQKLVGSDTTFLINLIPVLRDIIDVPSSETVHVGGKEAQNRVKIVFRNFVQAIASFGRPLVLFLDDLQWADAISLEVMKSLVMDTENGSFVCIGSYRDNEVNETHILTKMLQDIKANSTTITNIKVGDLKVEDTNRLVSEILLMSPKSTQPLADVVHRKTSGNVLFILQFVRSLFDEGLLRFSFSTKKWLWDTTTIESKNIADNAVDLMSQKILKLPKETQSVVKMMACLGSDCEESTLRLIAENNIAGKVNSEDGAGCTIFYEYNDLIGSLELAVNAGLLDYVGTKYKFAHDQIQLAAYNLIPENEKGLWHLQIGNQIWTSKDAEPEKVIFKAVVQLNLGVMFINEKAQKIELARLNLKAGESAGLSVSHQLAASFFKAGVKLLDERCWEEHYDLTIRLYECYAEAEYCNGEFDNLNEALNKIFANARCFEDQRSAYFTQIWALAAQEKMEKAIEVGMQVLAKLGEPFPTSTISEEMVLSDFSKTKQMLNGKADAELLELRLLTDGKKITAMKMMNALAFFANLTKQKIVFLIVFRSMQISLSFGICNESLMGFASYGAILAGSFSDIDNAYRFGKLSLRLLERLQAREFSHRILSTVYGLINSWVEHHHASLKPLEDAYINGMRYGDIQWAFTSIQQYCAHSYQCGKELALVEEDLRKYGKYMKEYKQTIILKYSLPYRQAILNLMGLSSNPLQLTGDAMNQEQLLEGALEKKNINLVFVIFSQCTLVAYMFGDYDVASEMADKAQYIVDRSNSSTYSVCSHTYYHGLIAILLARKSKDDKWKSLAQTAIEKMTGWTKHSPSNCEHKLLLMKAEYAFLLGDTENAARMYDSAIEIAGKNGFIQEQALAFERAGLFYFETGDVSKASNYYGKAHSAYLKWGAQGKVDHLLRHCPF